MKAKETIERKNMEEANRGREWNRERGRDVEIKEERRDSIYLHNSINRSLINLLGLTTTPLLFLN